jgi:hypothetical protein
MRCLLRREMMSAAASISTSTALRSQFKPDSRFWPFSDIELRQINDRFWEGRR